MLASSRGRAGAAAELQVPLLLPGPCRRVLVAVGRRVACYRATTAVVVGAVGPRRARSGLGFAAGGIPSAIVDASQTEGEDRSAVYVHVHLPLYLPLYLHCIQARGWIQCITAYPQTPSTVFTI